MSETLVLTLKPNNVSNTTLISQHGDIVYTVVTEHTKKTTTTYVHKDAGGELIASLEWRDIRPDRVSFRESKPISIGDWMRKSLVPFKDDISFVDDLGRKYKWKGHSPGRSLELYTAEDGYSDTIAYFQAPQRALAEPTDETSIVGSNASTLSLTPTLVNPGDSSIVWTHATLTLTPRAREIRDTVVTAFLFLEKTRRTIENDRKTRAGMPTTPYVQGAIGTSATFQNASW